MEKKTVKRDPSFAAEELSEEQLVLSSSAITNDRAKQAGKNTNQGNDVHIKRDITFGAEVCGGGVLTS